MLTIDLVVDSSTCCLGGRVEHLALNVGCRGNGPIGHPQDEVCFIECGCERSGWHQSCTVDSGVRLNDLDNNVDVFRMLHAGCVCHVVSEILCVARLGQILDISKVYADLYG